jgi:putative protease
MIEYIPELVEAGIDSFKIEGRMKTALYVATVARTYRKAIDDFFESEEKYRANMEWYKNEISKCTYRQFTTGFYFGRTDENTQIYDSNTYVNEYIYLGMACEVRNKNTVVEPDITGDTQLIRIEQKNKFCTGDKIEIMKPDGNNIPVTVLAMYDESFNPVDSCPHSKQIIWLELSEKADKYDILRVSNEGI